MTDIPHATADAPRSADLPRATARHSHGGGRPTLVVLAAGMGSRFGGPKQLEPVGPHGETMMEYGMFDALRAGFGDVVVITRAELDERIRAVLDATVGKRAPIRYVYQNLEDMPTGFTAPADRSKPWGTGHAVLCAEPAVERAFGVVNADDFYGSRSYRLISQFFAEGRGTRDGGRGRPFELADRPMPSRSFQRRYASRLPPPASRCSTLDLRPSTLDEEFSKHPVRRQSVEIIRIHHPERPLHRGLGAEHGVPRAPRLRAVGRRDEARRQVLEQLEHVADRRARSDAGVEHGADALLELRTRDHDHLAEAGAERVEDAVLHHRLAVRPHRLELLRSAEAAAHPGGEDDERRRGIHLAASRRARSVDHGVASSVST